MYVFFTRWFGWLVFFLTYGTKKSLLDVTVVIGFNVVRYYTQFAHFCLHAMPCHAMQFAPLIIMSCLVALHHYLFLIYVHY